MLWKGRGGGGGGTCKNPLSLLLSYMPRKYRMAFNKKNLKYLCLVLYTFLESKICALHFFLKKEIYFSALRTPIILFVCVGSEGVRLQCRLIPCCTSRDRTPCSNGLLNSTSRRRADALEREKKWRRHFLCGKLTCIIKFCTHFFSFYLREPF